jgi:hypothetical protein
MRLLFALPFLGLIVTGCYTYRPLISDLAGERGNGDFDFNRRSPLVASSVSTDTAVTFQFIPEAEASPWRLKSINPEIIAGDVYLHAYYDYAHRWAGVTNMTVDFSASRFPSDWKQRLYWIEQESFTSPLRCFEKHFR